MPVKILVADDSATMRKIMVMTFAGEDAEVVAVDSGEAALAKAREVQPDVVFADASMNGMDGYGLSQQLKAENPNVAVIVLSSQHNAFDADRGRSAGVDDHVAKPFDTQVVIDKVMEVMSKPRAAAAAGAQPPAPAPAPAPPSGPTQTAKSKHKRTVAFDAKAAPAPPAPPAPPARPVLELAEEPPAAKPAPPKPPPARKPAPRAAAAAAAATGNGSAMASKLGELGLSPEQLDAVLALSREVIEQVVWEVVPDLAETIIREEIKRLTSG